MDSNLNPDFVYYGDLEILQHKFTCSDEDIIDFDVYGKYISVVQNKAVKIYNLDESVLYKKFVFEEEIWCARFLNNRLYCVTKKCSIIQVDFMTISNGVTIYDLLSSIYYKQLTAVPIKQHQIARTIESKYVIPEKPLFLVNYNTSQIIYQFQLKGKQILLLVDHLQRVYCYNNFPFQVTCLSFTEEPDIIAVGTLSGIVQLLDTRKSSILTLAQPCKSSVQMIVQEKGYFIITHSNGAVYIYDIVIKELNQKCWKLKPNDDEKVKEKQIQKNLVNQQADPSLMLSEQPSNYGVRVGENPLKEKLFSDQHAGGLIDSDDESCTAEQLAMKRPAIEQIFSSSGGNLGGTLITLFSNAMLQINDISAEKSTHQTNSHTIPLIPVQETDIRLKQLSETPECNQIELEQEISPQKLQLDNIQVMENKNDIQLQNLQQDSLELSPEHQINSPGFECIKKEEQQILPVQESFQIIDLLPDQNKIKESISDLKMYQREQMGLKQLIDLYKKRRKTFIRKLQTQSGRLFALLDGHLLQLPVTLNYNLVGFDQQSLFQRQKQLLELLDYLEIYYFPHKDNIISVFEQQTQNDQQEQRPKTRGQDYAEEIEGFLDIQKQKEVDEAEQENERKKLLNQMIGNGPSQLLCNNSFQVESLQDPLQREHEKPLLTIKISKSMDYFPKTQEKKKIDLSVENRADSQRPSGTDDLKSTPREKGFKSHPLSKSLYKRVDKQNVGDLLLEELMYEDDEVFRQVLQQKIQRLSKQSSISDFDIRNLQTLTRVNYSLQEKKPDQYKYESKQQARERHIKEATETLQNFYQQFLGIQISDLSEEQQYYHNLDNTVANGISQYNGEISTINDQSGQSFRNSMRQQMTTRIPSQVTRRTWNPHTKDAEQVDLDFDNYPPLRILGGPTAQRSYKAKQRMMAKLLQMYTATKFSGPEAFEIIKQMFIKKLKDDEERARQKEEEERQRIIEWKRRKKELVMKYYESEDDSDSPIQSPQDQEDGVTQQNTENCSGQQYSEKPTYYANTQLIQSKKSVKTEEQRKIYKYGSSSNTQSRQSSRDQVKKVNVSGLAARILEVQEEQEIFHEREAAYDALERYSRGSSRKTSVRRDHSNNGSSPLSQSPVSRKRSRVNTATKAYNRAETDHHYEALQEEDDYEDDPKFALAQKRNVGGPKKGRAGEQISRPPSTTMKGRKLSSNKSAMKSRRSSRYAESINDKDSEYTVSYVIMDHKVSRRGSAVYEDRYSYISEEAEDDLTGDPSYKGAKGIIREPTDAYRKTRGETRRHSRRRSEEKALNTSPIDQKIKRGTRDDRKVNQSIDISQYESDYSEMLTSMTSDVDDDQKTGGRKAKNKGESFRHNKVISADERQKLKEINKALKILAARKFFSAENIDVALAEVVNVPESENLERQIKKVQNSLLRVPMTDEYYLIRNFRCSKGRQPSLSAYQMAALFILFCFVNKEKVNIKTILQGLTNAQFSNDEVFEISKEIRRIQADYQGNNQLEIPEKERRLQNVSQWRNDKIYPDDLNQLDLSQNSSFSYSSKYKKKDQKPRKRKDKTQQKHDKSYVDEISITESEDFTPSVDLDMKELPNAMDDSSSYLTSSRTNQTQKQLQKSIKSGRSDKNKSKLNQLSSLMEQQEKQAIKRQKEQDKLRKKQELQRLQEEEERQRQEEELRCQKELEEEEARRELEAAMEAERLRQQELQREAEEEAKYRVVLTEQDLLQLQLAQYFDPITLKYEKNKLTKVYAPSVPKEIFRSQSIPYRITDERFRDDEYINLSIYHPEIPEYYNTFKKNLIMFLKIFNVDYDRVKEKYQPSEVFNFDSVFQRIQNTSKTSQIPIFMHHINMKKFFTFYSEQIEPVFEFNSIKLKYFGVEEKSKPDRSISMPQMLYDFSHIQEDLTGSQSSSTLRPSSRDGRKMPRPNFSQIQQQKQAELAKENMKKVYKEKAPIIQQLQRTNIFEWTYQSLVEKVVSDDQNQAYMKDLKSKSIKKNDTKNKQCVPLKQSLFKYVTSIDDYKIVANQIHLHPSGKRRRSKSVDLTEVQSLSHRLNRKMLLQTYNDSFMFNGYKIENQANKTLQQIQNEVVTMNNQLDTYDDSIINQKYIVDEDEKTYQIITGQQFGSVKNGLQINGGFYIINEQQVLPSIQLFDDQWLFGGFETFRNYDVSARYGIIYNQQSTLQSAIQKLNENALKNFKELPQPLITPPPAFDEVSIHKDLVFSTPYDLQKHARCEQLKIDRYIARQERLFQRRAAIGKAEESKLYLEKKKRIEAMIEARKKLQNAFLEFPNELLQIILIQNSTDWILSKCEGVFQLPKQITMGDITINIDVKIKKPLRLQVSQPAFNIEPIAVMNMQRYFGNTQITLIGNIKYIIKFQTEKVFYEKLEKLKEYTFNYEQTMIEPYNFMNSVFFHFFQQYSIEKFFVLSQNEENWEEILFKKYNAAQEIKKKQLQEEMKRQKELLEQQKIQEEEKIVNETQSIIQGFMNGGDERKLAQIMLLGQKNELNITKVDINKQVQLGEKETEYKFYHKLNDFAFSTLVLKQQLIKQIGFKKLIVDWIIPFTTELDYGQIDDKKHKLFYGLAHKSLQGQSNCGIAQFCKGVESSKEFHRKNLLQGIIVKENTAIPKDAEDSPGIQADTNHLSLSPVQQAIAQEKQRLLKLQYRAEVEDIITRPIRPSKTLMKSLNINDGENVLQYTINRNLMVETGDLEESSQFESETTHQRQISKSTSKNTNDSYKYKLSRQDSTNSRITSQNEHSESSLNIVQFGSNKSRTSSNMSEVMRPIIRAASPTIRRNLIKSGQSTRVQIELKRIHSRGATRRSPMPRQGITVEDLKNENPTQTVIINAQPSVQKPKYNNAISVMEANSKKPLRSPVSRENDDEEIKLRVVSKQLNRVHINLQ